MVQLEACQSKPSAVSLTLVSQVPGDIKFNYFDAEGNMQAVAVDDLTKGKKVHAATLA